MLCASLPPFVKPPLPPVRIKDRLQLKKLSLPRGMSQETLAFTADVWFDGKKIGAARNDGGGGSTTIYPAARGALEEATEWARTLPPASAYNPLYEELMSGARLSSEGLSEEELKDEWWFHTARTGFDELVSRLAEDADMRKRIRGRNAMFSLGPSKDGESPAVVVRYSKVPSAAQLDRERLQYEWCVPLDLMLDAIAGVYYPSPHPFGAGWPRQLVRVNGQTGGVVGMDTTDDRVAVQFYKDGEIPREVEPMFFNPEEVELAPPQAEAAGADPIAR